MKNIADNKNFWKTVNPFFGDKGGSRNKVVLVENEKIINDDQEVAQIFNDYFNDAVKSLGISAFQKTKSYLRNLSHPLELSLIHI